MRWMPLRERLRRGAGRGSRRARAGAAACLAFVALALAVPTPAAAYRCEDAPSGMARTVQRAGECPVPAEKKRGRQEQKRGSMSSLTVLVLAVAAVLLIPIGARGIPSSIDPYRYEEPYE